MLQPINATPYKLSGGKIVGSYAFLHQFDHRTCLWLIFFLIAFEDIWFIKTEILCIPWGEKIEDTCAWSLYTPDLIVKL